MGIVSDLARKKLLWSAVKRFTNLQGFFNLNLAQLRKIRDERRSALSNESSDQSEGISAPVCTGPTILCGMP